MAIEFTSFDPETDIPQQRDLFRDSFPEVVGLPSESVDHYHWKFQSFPASPPSYEYAAREDGRLIGYYAAIPYEYKINGREKTCGMVCDVMTHSSIRRRGVFTNLGKYSVEELTHTGLDFLTGYPIRPEVVPGHIKVGWRKTISLPMYIRFVKVDSVFAGKGIGILAPLANPGALLYDKITLLSPGAPRHAVEISSPSDLDRLEGYARFFEAWSVGVRNHLVKSLEFLKWRLGAPGTRYYIVAIRGMDGEIAAMAIVRPAPLQGVPSLAILDLMIPNDNLDYCAALYRSLTALAKALRLEALVAMMSRTHAAACRMVRHGFVQSPFMFSLIAYPLKDSVDEGIFQREEDWRLMWIDSDDL